VWQEDLLATARAHGIAHVLDPDFEVPEDPAAYGEYRMQQAWMYMVFKKIIKTPNGAEIVREHLMDFDMVAIITKLSADARTSTAARINLRTLFDLIVTTRYNSDYRGTATSFVQTFISRLTDYNTRVLDKHKIKRYEAKNYLRNALSPNKAMNDIELREAERVIAGEKEYSFQEYLGMVKHQATLIDERNASRRSAHNHTLHGLGQDDDTPADAHEDTGLNLSELIVNAAEARPPGARMDRSTWRSLTPEAQEIWDQLDDENKAKILRLRNGSNQSTRGNSSRRKAQANLVEHGGMDRGNETSEEEDDDEDAEVQVNQTDVVSKAKDEAHPADPRKMMATQGSTGKPSKRSANTAQLQRFQYHEEDIDEMLSDDWYDADQWDSGSDSESDFY